MTALIWGITPSFHRVGINASNEIFLTISLLAIQAILWLPVLVLTGQEQLKGFRAHLKNLSVVSLFTGLSLISMVLAIAFGLVSYVVAIRRAGATLLSVLLGSKILEEGNVRTRFTAAVVMSCGIVLIVI